MSSVELTKTYHHLFPVAGFVESMQPVMLHEHRCDGESSAVTSASDVNHLAAAPPSGRCFGCLSKLPITSAKVTLSSKSASTTATALGYECPSCLRTFCTPCDELIHSVLHSCPGCELKGVST
mmetsp:Transcript_49379/g.128813  ORF Transcript_49379/g.128813 Transcript_49379/m.128813 type:complete len:123 (+) Transcript_49379:1098-1466(+)